MSAGDGEKFRESTSATDSYTSFKSNVTDALYQAFFVGSGGKSQKGIHSQVGSRFCEGDRTVDDSRGLGKYSAWCTMPRNAISQKNPWQKVRIFSAQ